MGSQLSSNVPIYHEMFQCQLSSNVPIYHQINPIYRLKICNLYFSFSGTERNDQLWQEGQIRKHQKSFAVYRSKIGN
jgi:hypothetical protein